jgi:predicted ATP-binding protein involved in virulence
MQSKNLENSMLIEPYANLFSSTGELYDAQERLLNLHHAALEEEKIEGEAKESGILLEKIKKLLVDILPQVVDTDSIIIKGSERLVFIRNPFGDIPLNSLSLGYRTMTALAVDMAFRMFPLDPKSKEKYIKVPAIVIIDEIDLHLHPQRQREVKEYFTTHFPLTQFICTAHSPIMVQASEDENLCVLHCQGDHAFIENEPANTHGWRIDQLIISLFGVPVRSPEIEERIRERNTLVRKSTLSDKEELRLAELGDFVRKLPVAENSQDQEMINSIRKAAKLLREKRQDL